MTHKERTFKHRYSPVDNVISEQGGESRTQPQFVNQTNIHSILKRSGMGEDMSFLARPVLFSEEEILEHDYHSMLS